MKNENSYYICDWILELILPNLYIDLKQNGFTNLTEFLIKSLNNNEKQNHDCLNNRIFLTYVKDLSGYLNWCNQIESNAFYAIWLFNLFQPLIITLSITLFLLPSLVVVFIYASSLFLFLSKHWSKLKVSYFIFLASHLLIFTCIEHFLFVHVKIMLFTLIYY